MFYDRIGSLCIAFNISPLIPAATNSAALRPWPNPFPTPVTAPSSLLLLGLVRDCCLIIKSCHIGWTPFYPQFSDQVPLNRKLEVDRSAPREGANTDGPQFIISAFSYRSLGSHGKNILQWFAIPSSSGPRFVVRTLFFCQNSLLWPVCLGWHCVAWLIASLSYASCFTTTRLRSMKGEELVNPKGNQSWMFIGRTNAEAEVPILWPHDETSWFIGKDPDAGKDQG